MSDPGSSSADNIESITMSTHIRTDQLRHGENVFYNTV